MRIAIDTSRIERSAALTGVQANAYSITMPITTTTTTTTGWGALGMD